MIPLISALAAMAEEYAIVRRALVVYRATNTVDSIVQTVAAMKEDKIASERNVPFDELYFYLVGGGIYASIYASASTTRPSWDEVWEYCDEAVGSERLANAAPDTINKLASFITAFGQVMANRDPDSETPLAESILKQINEEQPADLVIAAMADETLIKSLTTHVTQLGVDPNIIMSVISMFKKGAEIPYLQGIKAKQLKEGINLADTPMNVIYMMYQNSRERSAPIVAGSGTGTLLITTAYLPSMRATPVTFRPAKGQSKSLTKADLDRAQEDVMSNRGYAFDNETKSYVPKVNVLVQELKDKVVGTPEESAMKIVRNMGKNAMARLIANKQVESLLVKSIKPRKRK